VAIKKDLYWYVFDLALLDSLWQDYPVGELIERVNSGNLLDPAVAEEARNLAVGVEGVRWLGQSYLGAHADEDPLELVRQEAKDLTSNLKILAKAGAAEKTLWEFYGSRWFYERWVGDVPGELEVDLGLMAHVTYTGVRFRDQNFHDILLGPCKEKNLLQRNVVGGNVMEVPPIEEIGYHPDFQEALLGIAEGYIRERVTRTEFGDSAWSLVNSLQRSMRFAKDKDLTTYIAVEDPVMDAPEFSPNARQDTHRKTAPARRPVPPPPPPPAPKESAT
jgi:hypothetical protein